MSLATKTGYENVLVAMQQYVRGEMPDLIDAVNALQSATINAYKKGPYTFSADKKMNLNLNRAGTDIGVTIAAGTYTASQLATYLNDASRLGATDLTAETIMDGNYISIYYSTRGAASSISVTSEISELGWNSGMSENYYPLRDPAEVSIVWDNVPPMAYPAIHIMATGETEGDYNVMRTYGVRLRLFEVSPEASQYQLLYILISRYSLLIRDLLAPVSGSRSMDNQINALRYNAIQITDNIESYGENNSVLFRGFVDFDLEIEVQED